jgi:erythromycin esterase-like protein
MARNVLDAIASPGRRAVLWAHNAHIGNDEGMLGALLSQRLGASYVRIGSVLGGGSCTALRMRDRSVVISPLAAAPAGSLEAAWAALGTRAFLDVRIPQASAARRQQSSDARVWWLADEVPARADIGFFEMPAEYIHTTYRYAQRFDALYFIPESTPARPIREWPRGVPMNDWDGVD